LKDHIPYYQHQGDEREPKSPFTNNLKRPSRSWMQPQNQEDRRIAVGAAFHFYDSKIPEKRFQK